MPAGSASSSSSTTCRLSRVGRTAAGDGSRTSDRGRRTRRGARGQDGPGGVPGRRRPMTLLHVEDVSAGYGEIDIVREMNLILATGEIVTIAGTNGAGKSTLVKAIMGLAPRCRGRIDFDGHDLLRLAP